MAGLWSCQAKKPLKKNIQARSFDRSQRMDVLAFGSCNKHDKKQPLWKSIKAQQPDVWLWLGDIIYGDTENMRELQSYYSAQKNQEDYQDFLASGCDVIGVWDDHDYGVNDGGEEYPYRSESRDLLFEFLDVPENDPNRLHEGAYSSQTYGSGKEKTKVILLDARYFRDELKPNRSSKHRYKPNKTGDLLGDEQWAWLEKELAESDAAIHIIACGIQMIPSEHYFEKWSNFPAERERLFQLLGDDKTPGVILLSGDRHAGELSKMDVKGLEYPVYELTSSGLTHYWDFDEDKEPNKYRVGNRVGNYNYGLVKIDWSKSPLEADLQLRGLGDDLYWSQRVSF